MKKLLTFGVAIAAIASMTSCKKDYTCSCTGIPLIDTYSYTIPDAKKSDAEDACSAYATTVGGTCSID